MEWENHTQIVTAMSKWDGRQGGEKKLLKLGNKQVEIVEINSEILREWLLPNNSKNY